MRFVPLIALMLTSILTSCAFGSAPGAQPTPNYTGAQSATSIPERRIAGDAGYRDQLAVADEFFLTLNHVPQPAAGMIYNGWLRDERGQTVNIGQLVVAANGSAALVWISPTGENLLRRYTQFLLTLEPDAGVAHPTGAVAAVGSLEGADLALARRLLVINKGDPATPHDTALARGMMDETQLAAQHLQNAKNAAALDALPEMCAHLEHIVNILEGIGRPRYGDHDGNGAAENPGDGFGVVGYAAQIAALLPGESEISARIERQSAAIEQICLEIIALDDPAVIGARLADAEVLMAQMQNELVSRLYQAAQDTDHFPVAPAE